MYSAVVSFVLVVVVTFKKMPFLLGQLHILAVCVTKTVLLPKFVTSNIMLCSIVIVHSLVQQFVAEMTCYVSSGVFNPTQLFWGLYMPLCKVGVILSGCCS